MFFFFFDNLWLNSIKIISSIHFQFNVRSTRPLITHLRMCIVQLLLLLFLPQSKYDSTEKEITDFLCSVKENLFKLLSSFSSGLVEVSDRGCFAPWGRGNQVLLAKWEIYLPCIFFCRSNPRIERALLGSICFDARRPSKPG